MLTGTVRFHSTRKRNSPRVIWPSTARTCHCRIYKPFTDASREDTSTSGEVSLPIVSTCSAFRGSINLSIERFRSILELKRSWTGTLAPCTTASAPGVADRRTAWPYTGIAKYRHPVAISCLPSFRKYMRLNDDHAVQSDSFCFLCRPGRRKMLRRWRPLYINASRRNGTRHDVVP